LGIEGKPQAILDSVPSPHGSIGIDIQMELQKLKQLNKEKGINYIRTHIFLLLLLFNLFSFFD
jgi:hypothetical protein